MHPIKISGENTAWLNAIIYTKVCLHVVLYRYKLKVYSLCDLVNYLLMTDFKLCMLEQLVVEDDCCV